MARLSALDAMVNDVQAYFVEVGLAEVVTFGRRGLNYQLNQLPSPARAGRVVFIPGDEEGKAGKLGPPKEIGTIPARAIYTFAELAEVQVWGRSVDSPNDERAHYRVVWDLFEATLAAIRCSSVGRFDFGDPRWVQTGKGSGTPPGGIDRTFGAALVMQIQVHGRVCEPDRAVVNPTTPDVTDSAMSFPDGTTETA
jgi:hypothetical protein